MGEYTERRIIVVRVLDKEKANSKAKEVHASSGLNTFTVPLYTGLVNTHYWCSWQMKPSEWMAMKSRLDLEFGSANYWFYDGDVTTNAAVLSTHSLAVKNESI